MPIRLAGIMVGQARLGESRMGKASPGMSMAGKGYGESSLQPHAPLGFLAGEAGRGPVRQGQVWQGQAGEARRVWVG